MAHYKTPSDLVQIPIVWRYELLKYLRSWRLLASIAISLAVLALIFFLPPALGQPYSGTDTNVRLELTYIGSAGGGLPFETVGALARTGVNIDNLVVYRNGTVYPEENWALARIENELSEAFLPAGAYVIFFPENVTGDVMTATYDWRITPQYFETLILQFATILIIICATFFAADSLVGEYFNRTGYLIFPNPLKREVLFFGKYAASITAGLIVLGVFYLGVTGLSFIAAGGLDDDLGLSFLFAVEYLLAAAAVGYVVSSLMKGTTGAIVLTFLLLFLILPIVDGVSSFASVKISASLTFAANVIFYVLVDPYPKDTTVEFGGLTFSNYFPEPVTSAIVMMAYAVGAVAISLILFKRKQLTG
jgi:ABC-2 type transport system permease protein